MLSCELQNFIRDALEIEEKSIDESINFTEIDSLNKVQLIIALEDYCEVTLSIVDLFECKTIEEISD